MHELVINVEREREREGGRERGRERERERERDVCCAYEMRPSNRPDANIKVKEQ